MGKRCMNCGQGPREDDGLCSAYCRSMWDSRPACVKCGAKPTLADDPRCRPCYRATEPGDYRPGDRVIYSPASGPHQPPEEGTVTSVGDRYVFVCYGLPGSTSKATDPRDLQPLRPSDDDRG